ncbi:MAG TPA: 3-hydroxyacyl-CoA dehydrogenase NAD-binding domain-containing protein [Chloroflexota bacterium]|jgi:3-hydroxybutyryl-CoA dehydrogenase|nr:3-hydroxyacyl-CoA dehydrogenase NAD-binding domain-containing protein [Chloroflexota bacterium]
MPADHIRKIAVVGAGLMGHGIGQVLALASRDVVLTDARAEALPRAREGIARNLELFVEHDLVTRAEAEAALGRVHLEPGFERAVADADYVVEAVFEDLELKKRVFADLDRACRPGVILTSNTSGLSSNAIAALTNRKPRCCVTHFWNPPHILPLVEVVRNDETSDETVETILALLRSANKVPVVVRRDIPGQVGNRLQYALFREAVSLVEKGVCSAEDVDTVIKMSFGRRLSTIGVLETADVNATALWANISHYLFRELDCAQDTHPYLEDLIAQGRTGVNAGAGFHDWPAEKLARTLARRDRELLRWLQQDKREREAAG